MVFYFVTSWRLFHSASAQGSRVGGVYCFEPLWPRNDSYHWKDGGECAQEEKEMYFMEFIALSATSLKNINFV